jgi:hypothetical protein
MDGESAGAEKNIENLLRIKYTCICCPCNMHGIMSAGAGTVPYVI